jgi:hypothetical protein
MADQAPLFGFDPFADWASQTRRELAQAGYKVADALDNDEVARAWLNVGRRVIEPRPRSVFRARELAPSSEEAAPVDEIQRRAENGLDLNCFLSKRLLDAHFQDKLLFDWGIHHFHLNLKLEASGFVRRSRRLLFARVTSDAVYLIAIRGHRSWTDETLVEIIHQNWPWTIEAFRLPGIVALTQSTSPEERSDLRRAGVQTLVCTSDGVTYGLLGGGYATDGSSLGVTQDLISFREYFKQLKEVVQGVCGDICAAAWSAGVNPATLRLRLVYEGEQPFAQDDGARFRVRLPPFAVPKRGRC